MTIVLGGDTNQLDVKDLCQLTGWNSLVEFPSKGVAYLDNVLANRPDLFAINKKQITRRSFYQRDQNSNLFAKKFASGIAENTERRRYTWNLRERLGIVSWEPTMWMRRITWKLLFTDTWTSACHSEQFVSHRVIRLG